MALSNAQLTAFFTTANQGAAPTAAQATLIAGIAANTSLTDLQQQIAVGGYNLLQSTVGVAALSYAYFGNTLPSAAGIAFLVSSPTNATDLNDPYYAQFNQENRFLNFALNLTRGAGAPYGPQFSTAFNSLSIADTISTAYEAIIGSAAATAAGFDPVAGKAFFLNSLTFYQKVVIERGGLAASDPAFTLAVKAAIVGSVINEGIKANIGIYSDAYQKLSINLETGIATGLGTPLLTAFPSTPNVLFTANTAGFNTATGSTSIVGSDHHGGGQ